MQKRCIAVWDLHSPLTRCTSKVVDGELLCVEHLKQGKESKVAVLVVAEIKDRIKPDYPHLTVELKF